MKETTMLTAPFRRVVTGHDAQDRAIIQQDAPPPRVQHIGGDIVIQRGTNHGWANRSTENCRIAFVLIDGAFEPGLD